MDTQDHDKSGNSRRSILKCMAWAGTGIVWSVAGGVPAAMNLGGAALAAPADGFSFVQISDTHIGFKAEANPDPNATLQVALDKIAALPTKPAMMIHTGDVTHLSKPEQFDTADQILKGAKLDTHFVPGEHDVIGDDGKMYFDRFGAKGAPAGGWYSFDQGGVHFVALMNVIGFGPATGGTLGKEQLDWLEKPTSRARAPARRSSSWRTSRCGRSFPEWGWTTSDADQALPLSEAFGSVTVLNGHIHQVVQKVEGKCHLPDRDVDRLSAARSRHGAQPRPDEGSGRQAEIGARHPRDHICADHRPRYH
jgi:Icc protein